MASRIRITRRQKDKAGNVWLRDNYGGWTNEYGVRFTKNEHRRFGYRIRQANKVIEKYMKEYPKPKQMKSTEVGGRFRNRDLARFRRRASYENYLKVTESIILGKKLYVSMPNIYRENLTNAVYNAQRILKQGGVEAGSLINQLLIKLNKLTPSDLINLSHNPLTPDINSYYLTISDILIGNLERLNSLI